MRSAKIDLRRVEFAQLLEINTFRDQLAQRVDIQWVKLIGRKRARACLPASQPHLRPAALQLARLAHLCNLAPKVGQSPLGGMPSGLRVVRVLGKAMAQQHGIHRPCTRATDAVQLQAPVVQQCIEHAPSKRPMRAAALQRQTHGFLNHILGHRRREF